MRGEVSKTTGSTGVSGSACSVLWVAILLVVCFIGSRTRVSVVSISLGLEEGTGGMILPSLLGDVGEEGREGGSLMLGSSSRESSSAGKLPLGGGY